MSEIPKYHPHLLFEAASKAWPKSVVVAGEVAPEVNPKVCVVLCPLYTPGPLEESNLLASPFGISDSRVVNKIHAYSNVLEALQSSIGEWGGKLDLKIAFANKGVLGNHNESEVEQLVYHEEVYRKWFANLNQKLNIDINFFNYNDLGINFPTFIDMDRLPENLSIPTKDGEKYMLESFNQLLVLASVVPTNKDARKVVKNIVGGEGFNFVSAFWVIAGYLAFDWKIHQLIGDGGIYIMAERFDPLFWIYKLTPSLKRVNKILLKA